MDVSDGVAVGAVRTLCAQDRRVDTHSDVCAFDSRPVFYSHFALNERGYELANEYVEHDIGNVGSLPEQLCLV